MIPDQHARFLSEAVKRLRTDPRIVGVAVGGSYLTGTLDEFSDLDMVIAVEPGEYAAVLNERRAIAEGLGSLLVAFTGEHVGEPRLLVCLYGPPLLHVDLKFVRLDEFMPRVEDPEILWERAGRMRAALAEGVSRYPEPDPQWIEDRFWVWIYYGATKIGRGELFEALDMLAFLRWQVLGPLAMSEAGGRPTGVRKLEVTAPARARAIEATVAAYDASSCTRALTATVTIYQDLRERRGRGVRRHAAAESAALAYLADLTSAARDRERSQSES